RYRTSIPSSDHQPDVREPDARSGTAVDRGSSAKAAALSIRDALRRSISVDLSGGGARGLEGAARARSGPVRRASSADPEWLSSGTTSHEKGMPLIGAALSRWTMSYFAVALLSLLAAETMMVAGLGFPAEVLRAPTTLVLVHLITIGWLSLTMCGALNQFIPVLTERPLNSDRLPLPALAFLTAGLIALILG